MGWLAYAAATAIAQATSWRSVLYVEGVLDNSYDNATMMKAAKDIASSGFDTVIFAFLHVNSSGSLVFNDIPFSDAHFFRYAMNEIIKGKGSTVKHALISIGGAGADGTDFPHIGANFSLFRSQAETLLAHFALDGFDLDEEDSWDEQALANITRLCGEKGWLLSASPVPGEDSQFQPLIAKTLCNSSGSSSSAGSLGHGSGDSYSAEMAQATAHSSAGLHCKSSPVGWSPFTFINLQTYGATGSEAGQAVADWVQALTTTLPAQQLQGMFIPGWETPGFSPTDLHSVTQAAVRASPTSAGASTCGGAFVWDYRLLHFIQPTQGWTATAYAQAINSAGER